MIDEVLFAVDRGYKILEIQEVYQYEVTQYDPNMGEGGLFVDYLNTFLKLKAVASSYPSWVRTPDEGIHSAVLSKWRNPARQRFDPI